jgi:kynurenine formamidase
MFRKEFASSYTSFDSTGAKYITQHTKVKLVGIDYLSIGCLEDIVETHRVLLGQVGLVHMVHSPSAAARPVQCQCKIVLLAAVGMSCRDSSCKA